jgi:uncharacterized protein
MPPSDVYPATGRTTPHRHRDRVVRDRSAVNDVLDAAYVCSLGFVVDGRPAILPMMYVRLDDVVYVHGSPGGHPFLSARHAGLDVCLAVTLVDGIVLARAAFNHSLNYRSAVVHGRAHGVADPALKRRMFHTLIERLVPGRLADTRPLTERELTTTTVLALELAEATVKVRAGGPKDTPEDQRLAHWAGVIPTAVTAGPPVPANGIGLPNYLRGYRDRTP